jgi:hemolysin activation/secretion protein
MKKNQLNFSKSKTNCGAIFCLVCFLILFPFSKAQANQNIIDQQDWITRNQQNIFEEKKRNAEFETIKKEHERKKKEEQRGGLKSAVSGKMNGGCVAIKEINFSGSHSISEKSQQKIVAPFIGKCVEAEVLAAVIKVVGDYYHAQGLITTQVKVPKQNLQNGIFELQIIEGKIEKISLGKDRFIEKMQRFTAFGNSEGESLNINDINQGISQINRLQSNSAVMKIEPGSESGESKIVIDNNKKFPIKFTVGKDNLGNKFTGEQRTSFSSSFDNLLFLNDNLNLNYSANYHDPSSFKDMKAFSSSFSIPFKYNTFSYDFSRSEYKGHLPAQNNMNTLTGYSQSSKLTLDRVFLNQSKLRLSGNVSLTEKTAASYKDGFKQDGSTRRLSLLNLSIVASSYLNETTSIYLRPSYSKGLKILNAKQDEINQSGATPKAQFEYFKFYANFSKNLTIPKTEIPLTFSSEIDSQYSKQTLFGSEQFSVGGYYSVRGFREGYITGDSGYYLRNKVNVNLGSLIAPFMKNKVAENQSFLSKNLVHLNKISFEPFYDYGYTKYKYVDNGSDGRLSGAGLKTIFNSKYFTASMTYSAAINKSRLITATTKENKLLYFEISATCC